MTQHTAGAVRAAIVITNHYDNPIDLNNCARTIDRETHAAEMLTFIEKVAAWPYTAPQGTAIFMVQEEAFALIKKVRG